MSYEKELADKLDAEERLKRHGYVKQDCENCMGKGGKHIPVSEVSAASHLLGICIVCGGRGYYYWKARATR